MGQRVDRSVVVLVGVLVIVAVVVVGAPLLFRPSVATPVNPGQPVDRGQPVNPGQPVSGAPQWAVPGSRLISYAAAASVAQSRFQWIEDPNCDLPADQRPEGQTCWVDPKTGKKYRRSDEQGPLGDPGRGPTTASGDGLSQIDIVALDGANVVLSSNLYTFDRTLNVGNLVWTPVGGSVTNATSVDGAWIHPQQLVAIAQNGFGDLLVLRGQYQLGTTTYDAISMVSGLGGGSNYLSYTYDMATGILLSANTSSASGVTTPLVAPGDMGPPRGNNQLTMARFQGFRQRTLPGVNDPSPGWVASTSQLTYRGTYNFINPVDPSSANLSYPIEHVATLQPGGASWSRFAARTVIPALAQDTQIQGVTGPTGVYWYSPQALAGMTAGQLLDEDPILREQTKVSFVGQAASGASVVVIESQLPGVFVRSTYDRATGELLEYQTQQASTGITISLQLADRR